MPSLKAAWTCTKRSSRPRLFPKTAAKLFSTWKTENEDTRHLFTLWVLSVGYPNMVNLVSKNLRSGDAALRARFSRLYPFVQYHRHCVAHVFADRFTDPCLHRQHVLTITH